MDNLENKIKVWKKRYTVRDFSKNTDDLKEKIDYLSNLFEYIPIQQSIIDHFWILLTPEDDKIKKVLFEEYYFYYHHPNEHMLPILTAPYIFLSCVYHPSTVVHVDQVRNVGLHAGVILSEALQLGLDVSTIGCLDGIHKSKNKLKKQKKFQKLLIDNFKKENIESFLMRDIEECVIFPNLAVCIGHGEPLTNKTFTKVNDFAVVTGQKIKKNKSNLIKK